MTVRLQDFQSAGPLNPGDLLYASQSGIEKKVLVGALQALMAAYSLVSVAYTQPAEGQNVSVQMGSTAWLATGLPVYVTGGGMYSVVSITNPTTAVLKNLGYPGNTNAGVTVSAVSGVVAGGIQGPTAFTSVLSGFSQPGVGSPFPMAFKTTAWMVAGSVIYIVGGGYYSISSIVDLNTAMVTNLGYPGNAAPGTSIATDAACGAGGLQGAGAYTTTAANFTQPASGSNVTFNVGSSAWLTVGQCVFVGGGGGYYNVQAIPTPNSVTLTNLGYTGNAAPAATVNSGAGVSAAGLAALASVTADAAGKASLDRGRVTAQSNGADVVSGGSYGIDTSAGAVSMYLPTYANSAVGDEVDFTNVKNYWPTNNFTLNCRANVFFTNTTTITPNTTDTTLVARTAIGGFKVRCAAKDGTNAYWIVIGS